MYSAMLICISEIVRVQFLKNGGYYSLLLCEIWFSGWSKSIGRYVELLTSIKFKLLKAPLESFTDLSMNIRFNFQLFFNKR